GRCPRATAPWSDVTWSDVGREPTNQLSDRLSPFRARAVDEQDPAGGQTCGRGRKSRRTGGNLVARERSPRLSAYRAAGRGHAPPARGVPASGRGPGARP